MKCPCCKSTKINKSVAALGFLSVTYFIKCQDCFYENFKCEDNNKPLFKKYKKIWGLKYIQEGGNENEESES